MKLLAFALALVFGLSTTTGCLVRDRRPSQGGVAKQKRGCPPAHHWNGHDCVHNGKAKGHKK